MTSFRPDLTPDQMERLGVLAGRYDSRDPKASNFFRVEASQKVWPDSWKHESAPMGWYDWYKQYHAGARGPDDERQIRRWESFRARHIAQLEKADPSLSNLDVHRKRRQALLHWALAPGLDIDKALEKGNVNAYLEKAAQIKERADKKESHTGRKILAGGAGTIISGMAVARPTRDLALSAFRHMERDGVSDSTLHGFKQKYNVDHIKHYRNDLAGVGPAFHPGHNEVYSKSNLAAMHEFGHAHNFNSLGEKARKAKHIGYMVGKGGLGALAGTAVALHGEKSDAKTAAGTAIAAASYAPMLHEEATASLKPLKYLKDHGHHAEHAVSKRALGKAFGTYALTAAAGVATPYLSRKIYESTRGKKDK